MEKALAGVLVLDLSQFLSGPRCTQILALLGAEVIKVEAPTGETMRQLLTLTGSERALSTIHQNKKGLVVDLKTEAGREVLRDLMATCDVLVENLAPGTLDQIGLGWEQAQKINPRLIYASISGFGRTGPQADKTAFDIISQATSGVMSANGQEDRPPGVFFGDLGAGAFAAIGVLAALRQRETTGRGQLVDVSMQDVMYFHNYWGFSEKANELVHDRITELFGRPVTRMLTDAKNPMPFWNSFKATDGYVAIVALTDRQWEALMRVIGREDLIGDQRFGNLISRVKNAAIGLKIVEAWTGRRTVGEITQALDAEKIPCGPVQSIEQAGSDPQLKARGMFKQVEHPRLGTIDVPGFCVQMSDSDTAVETPCPELGQHTDEILTELLSYDADKIARLKKKKAIG